MSEVKARKVRQAAERVQVAPGVFKASDTSYYIDVNGTMKYCIKSRLDKLLEKANGDYAVLVANYKTRARRSKSELATAS